MPGTQDGQHGCEGLTLAVGQRQGRVDGLGNVVHQGLKDALSGALAQGHGLDGRLHHVLRPAEGEAQEGFAQDSLAIGAEGARGARWEALGHGQGERLQPGPALGVVMGKSASRVSPAEALDYVAGYTVVNEFSLPEDSY